MAKKKKPSFVAPLSSEKIEYRIPKSKTNKTTTKQNGRSSWSPLNISMVNKVTPRTKKKIKERFARGLGLQVCPKSSPACVTSPGITLPFDFSLSQQSVNIGLNESQSSSNTVNNEDVHVEESQASTVAYIESSNRHSALNTQVELDTELNDSDEFDLKLSQKSDDNTENVLKTTLQGQRLSSNEELNKSIAVSEVTTNDMNHSPNVNIRKNKCYVGASSPSEIHVDTNNKNKQNHILEMKDKLNTETTHHREQEQNTSKQSKSCSKVKENEVTFVNTNTMEKKKKPKSNKKENVLKDKKKKLKSDKKEKVLKEVVNRNSGNVTTEINKDPFKFPESNNSKSLQYKTVETLKPHFKSASAGIFKAKFYNAKKIKLNENILLNNNQNKKLNDFWSPRTNVHKHKPVKIPKKPALVKKMAKEQVLSTILQMHLEIGRLQERRDKLVSQTTGSHVGVHHAGETDESSEDGQVTGDMLLVQDLKTSKASRVLRCLEE